ncbi:MAG: PQQ-binding-like beta-propeller repeat protein [Phycisphaerae bacterium]
MRRTTILTGLLILTLSGWCVAGEGSSSSAGYPQWRGPRGSGAAAESGAKLVASWSDAKLLWASEQRGPLPRGWHRSAVRPARQCGNGGFGPPVVVGKRVYVAAYEPNGPIAERTSGKLRRAPKLLRRVAANDVLYCIDSDTGQTLWKASFAKGLNMVEHANSGHYVPCVLNGRVYWVGTIGRMYCVDAETGEHIWDRPIDGWAEHTARYRAWCIRERKMPRQPSRDYKWQKARENSRNKVDSPEPEDNDSGDLCDEDAQARARTRDKLGLEGSRGWGWDSPVIAAGEDVVVTNTPGGAFVAFDADTGKELWQQRGVTTATRAPVVWKHRGKHYVLGLTRGGLKCFDARSGEKLWSSGLARSGSYGGNTPPIRGDILVAQGYDGEDAVGWSGLKLTLEGPKRLWILDRPIRCVYESPVIYKGHVWMALREPGRWRKDERDYLHNLAGKVFTRELLQRWRDQGVRGAIGVVELETGRFTAVVDGGHLGCSSLVAGDGRIFFQQGCSLAMLRADPENPEHLGQIYPEYLWSTTPTYAEGRLYHRGCEYTVNCWELRKDPPPVAAEGKQVDPANAKYTVNFECARIYEEGLKMASQRGGSIKPPKGEDLRLHLRTRKGRIVQSWITSSSDHPIPEWVFPETLKFDDDRLHGRFDALVLGRSYPMELNVEVDGNEVAGYWDDRFQANPVKGKIVGESRPVVDGTGTVNLRIRREWCGGQNKCFETHLTFEMKDGQSVADTADIKARVPRAAWEGEIVKLSATQKGSKLTGEFTAKLKSNNLVKSGLYTVKFTADVVCNRPSGSYRSWYEGREITPRSKVNQGIWGTFEVPKDTTLDPANAMHEFVLEGVMPNKSDLRVSVELRKGKAVHTQARSPRYTRAAHKVDFSDVTLKGNRLVGPMDVIIATDGHVPPHDIPCEFNIDLAVTRTKIAGSYDGVYEKRESRSGSAEGSVKPSPKPTGR